MAAIRYIGTQIRWPELAVTGRQSVWFPGQIEDRPPAEEAALLGTGLFQPVEKRLSYLQAEFERQLSINGAVFNGTADDQPALQAALEAISSASQPGNGVRLQMPVGIAGLRAQLQIPRSITLIGQGRRGPFQFIGLSGFSGASLIRLGRTTDDLTFDCGLEDMKVNAVHAPIGLLASTLQEGSGGKRILVENASSVGISLANANNANWVFDDIEVYGAQGSLYGFHTVNPGAKSILSNITVIGLGTLGAANMTSGVRVETSGQMALSGMHFEGMTNGLDLTGNDVNVFAAGVSGPEVTSQGVTNLVRIQGSSRSVVVAIRKANAVNAVVDEFRGYSSSEAYVPLYSPAQVAAGVTYVPEPIGDGAQTPSVRNGFYKRVNTLTQNTTINAPTNAEPGQELIFRFTQDGTGGRTVTWNSVFKGVTLAASGTANQRAVIRFFFDGVFWFQTGTSGWVS